MKEAELSFNSQTTDYTPRQTKKCIQILAFIATKAIKVRLQFHFYCKSLLVKISIPLLPSCKDSAKLPHINNYFIVHFSNDRFILTIGFTKNDLT